jgi:hypothetical protein
LILNVFEGLVTVGTHIISVSWALLKNDGLLVDEDLEVLSGLLDDLGKV